MKNSNDNIENRTRDLPTCSAVSQPTALPRAPSCYVVRNKMSNHSQITLCQYTAAIVYSLCTTRSSRIVSTELTAFLT